jgi:4-amino-4-deoxychorismate lyase
MYSSLVDGIVTEPELMVVPFDDHAFIRGHAVFDTATLAGGKVCRLGIHLRRLFDSARDARLKLPFGPTEEENLARITEIVCKTCVASGLRDGNIRFFLSAGPGNFFIFSDGCEPAFYCAVYTGKFGILEPADECTVRCDSVPMKPPILARVKSNNYMLNCLTAMSAKDKGGTRGIHVRDDGTVAESCIANVFVITQDRVMLTPTFDGILAGTTVRKLMELAKKHLVGEQGLLREVRQEVVPAAALGAAAEICLTGGDTHMYPVRSLDGKVVGDGQTFPVANALFKLLMQDVAADTEDQIPLNYQ